MDEVETKESKYIQQHLANERTYLAWIRTALGMIGVGFLATTLHFNTQLNQFLNNTLALLISLFSLILGLITIFFSTLMYYRNRNNINSQTFRSSSKVIVFMTVMICVILLLFAVYYVYANTEG